jgi:hypothetical protein
MNAHAARRSLPSSHLLSLLVVAAGLACSSCATAVHGWNHRFTSPAYIGVRSGTVFVEGKEYDVKMVVSGADSKTKETNYYTYKTTTTTTTLYFDEAVLVFPKQKYITVEIRDDDNKTVRESYLLRRDPRYVWYGLDFYLTLGIGSIVDLADNLAYDWELVAYKKH